MAIPVWLGGLIPNLLNDVKEYILRKQKIREIETGAEIRIKEAEIESRIRRAESADKADGQIDRISVDNTGWKDEYLLIITSIPVLIYMISPFVDLYLLSTTSEQGPGATVAYTQGFLADAMTKGFTGMQQAPEYYWYALGAVYVHSLGMRRMVNNLLERITPFK